MNDPFYDKAQTRLTENGIEKNDFQYAIIKCGLKYDVEYVCPYCLYMGTVMKNYQRVKQFYQCKHCKNLIKAETLVKMLSFSPEQYAQWVFICRRTFFSKVNFEAWAKELYSFQGDFSTRFWNQYHKMRDAYTNEKEQEKDDYDDNEY